MAPTLTVDPTPFYYDGTGQAAAVTALGVDGVTPVDGTFSVTYDGSSTSARQCRHLHGDGHLHQQRSELSLDQHHRLDHDSARDAVRGPRQRRTVGIHLQRHAADGRRQRGRHRRGDADQRHASPTPITTSTGRTPALRPAAPRPSDRRGLLHLHRILHEPGPELRRRHLQLGSLDRSGLAHRDRQRRTVHLQRLVPRGDRLRGGHRWRDAGRRHGDVHLQRLHHVPTVAGTYAVFAEIHQQRPELLQRPVDGTLVINKATPAFSSLVVADGQRRHGHGHGERPHRRRLGRPGRR